MNREFVMLAKKFDQNYVGGWFVSEKLDGMRALWVPWSVGKLTTEIPWANTDKDKEPIVCTGLWSRLGKVIRCPEWWTQGLPEGVCLDGELWLGRNQFQNTISVTRSHHGDWTDVKYYVFDSPGYEAFLSDGKINNPMFKKEFSGFLKPQSTVMNRQFSAVYEWLLGLKLPDHVTVHEQVRLPTKGYFEVIREQLDKVILSKGEGLILRDPLSIWFPKRSNSLLKVKPYTDSEGIVTGYTWGKGKYEGMLGALRVKWKDVSFEIGTGFTDEQREMVGEDVLREGERNAGNKVNEGYSSLHFPKGTTVQFTYTGLTSYGVPREGRLLRKL